MKKIVLLILAIFLFQISYSQMKYKSFFEFDLRTIPALGFFPFYGNIPIQTPQFMTYITGFSFDLVNFTNKDEYRFSLISITPYLLGLNYSSLKENSKAQFFNTGMINIGPHYRFKGLMKSGRFALGCYFAYSFLLVNNSKYATFGYQHGISFGFTFSTSKFE